jgi:hypothetical protein
MITTSTADMAVISQLQLAPGSRLSKESAEAILKWQITENAQQQMRELLEKNSEGTIASEEMELLDAYARVGMLLDMMRAEAKRALRDQSAE